MSDTPPPAAPAAPAAPAPQSEGELPHWARDRISEANNEAAKYRVKAREATDAAKQTAAQEFAGQLSALSDQKAATAAELDTTKQALLKLRVALAVGIPGESAADFAELLKGSTEEEIKAHAEKVKSLFSTTSTPPPAVDSSQGLGGPVSTDAFGSFLLSKLSR